MNLINDPWIPVRYLTSESRKVSLKQAFLDSAKIADLECAPHERVSLMRLLVCITQRVQGLPEDIYSWSDYGSDLETEALLYLESSKIFPQFELFGSGPRFLQVDTKSKEDPTAASKMFPHLATGNNPTLNDHAGANPDRTFTPSQLALALLTFQNFYPLYGAGYKGKGPCVDSNMAHALLLGDNLKQCILLNCVAQTEASFPLVIGVPIWEIDFSERNASALATMSYLGRLVPRHRNIRLLEDGSGFFLDQESLVYPAFEEFREPSSTVYVRDKERRLVSLRTGHSLWRDLHYFIVLKKAEGTSGNAPLTVSSHQDDLPLYFRMWVGGLVTDLKAKILDTAESTFTVPLQLFKEEYRRHYQLGVEYADETSKRLYVSVKQYGASLKNENPPVDMASQYYWTTLDQQSSVLLDIVRAPTALETDFGEPGADDPWTYLVKQAATKAYADTCPRQTPRQLKAYSIGQRVLGSSKKKNSKQKPKE